MHYINIHNDFNYLLHIMIKILLHAHTYAHSATSGADIYAERLCTWLSDRCEVRVIVDKVAGEYKYKNHIVASNQYRIAENYEWCDVVLTNLVTNNQAIGLAERFKRPIFHIVHNDKMPYIQPSDNAYIIYNSYWLQKARPLNFQSIVVQPPTWPKDWKPSENGQYITLVNLTHNKGAETFRAIAQAMPQFSFLGVVGGYGTQYMQPLANIKRVPFTHDMQSIYDQTRVLIVPSVRESWSLCAAEAQCCGIPVVCSDLPGLRENLGDSAVYASSVRQYMDNITGLMCFEPSYDHYAVAGIENAQAKEKNHILQLENLFSFMENAVSGNGVKKNAIQEKVERTEAKEKKEVIQKANSREKKIINRPSTKQ